MALILGACSKVDKTTRKFMKEGRWEFDELTAEGKPIDNLAKWDITTCEDSEGYCPGTWIHADGTTAPFFWMFDKYNGDLSFYLSPEIKVDQNRAAIQCYNLAGTYQVVSSSSDMFEFQSMESRGYPQTLVYFSMHSR